MGLTMAVVGWAGMALLIAAYALVSTGRLAGTDPRYQAMNLVGAGALMVNTAYLSAWPSAVLNAVWILVGVAGLVQARRPVLEAERGG